MKKLIITILLVGLVASVGLLIKMPKTISVSKCEAEKTSIITQARKDLLPACESIVNQALCKAFTTTTVEMQVACQSESFILKRK